MSITSSFDKNFFMEMLVHVKGSLLDPFFLLYPNPPPRFGITGMGSLFPFSFLPEWLRFSPP